MNSLITCLTDLQVLTRTINVVFGESLSPIVGYGVKFLKLPRLSTPLLIKCGILYGDFDDIKIKVNPSFYRTGDQEFSRVWKPELHYLGPC